MRMMNLKKLPILPMIDGEFRTTLHIKEKPKRLCREDVLIYYTQKIRSIWANIPE